MSDDVTTGYETLHVLRITLVIVCVYAVQEWGVHMHSNVTYSRRIVFNFSRSVVRLGTDPPLAGKVYIRLCVARLRAY